MQGLVAPDHGADPLGTTDLVARQGQKISSQLIDIASNTTDALDRIDMHEGARSARQRGSLRHRLNNSGLVVGEHERDQRPSQTLLRQRRKKPPQG